MKQKVNVKRDEKIVFEILCGSTHSSLAKTYKVTPARISQVFSNWVKNGTATGK